MYEIYSRDEVTIVMNRLINKYPKTSFMIISKLLWIIGFMFTIYIIENRAPTLWQFSLASLYTIITLPVSYWLTYSFGVKDK